MNEGRRPIPQLLLAAVCAAAFVGTWALFLHTGTGERVDLRAYEHVSGNSAIAAKRIGAHALRTIDVGSVVVGLVAVALLGVRRASAARSVAAVVVVVASIGTAEALKHGLPQVGARPPTFPSGHVSVAASVGLALVLAAPPLLRMTATVVGAAYAAAVAWAVVALGWHYPSDAVASVFIAGFWTAIASATLRRSARRLSVSVVGVAIAAFTVAAALVVAAVLASHHENAVATLRTTRASTAAAVVFGVLCLAMFLACSLLAGEPDEAGARLQSRA
jgi:membrane-associated phospholipid phosphatase